MRRSKNALRGHLSSIYMTAHGKERGGFKLVGMEREMIDAEHNWVN
jgi:hypothetical protein